MTPLFGWLIARSVPKPLARGIEWFAILGALALALAILKGCYDRSVIRDHEREREAQTIEARDDAANERADDAISNARNEKDLHDAIDTAPAGGGLSPAAHALACERLRKLGRIPPACRPEGSDGTEAGSR